MRLADKAPSWFFQKLHRYSAHSAVHTKYPLQSLQYFPWPPPTHLINASLRHCSYNSTWFHTVLLLCMFLSITCLPFPVISAVGLGEVQIWICWGVNVYKENEASLEGKMSGLHTGSGDISYPLFSLSLRDITKTKAARIWSDNQPPKHFHPQGWDTQDRVKKGARDIAFLKHSTRKGPWMSTTEKWLYSDLIWHQTT